MGRGSMVRTSRENRMPDLEDFADFDEFLIWYQNLVPNEPINLEEAITIYFNLEFYNF
jgi:hypothetical protein